jgi:hypothetical protein
VTQSQFVALCETYGIAPSIALENESIRQALRDRNAAEVERILREEF